MTHLWPDAPPLVGAAERAAARLAAEAAAVEEPAEDARRDFSDRLIRRWLTLCESPRTRGAVLKLVKGSVGSHRAGQRFYAILNRAVVTPLARASGVQASALKIELVCAQLVGLAMMRYVLEIEPVASMDTEELAGQFAPAIRATLKG